MRQLQLSIELVDSAIDTELNVCVVGLAENRDGSGRHIMIMKSFEPELSQECVLVLSDEGKNVPYRLHQCLIGSQEVSATCSDEDSGEVFRILLAIDPTQMSLLHKGLSEVCPELIRSS